MELSACSKYEKCQRTASLEPPQDTTCAGRSVDMQPGLRRCWSMWRRDMRSTYILIRSDGDWKPMTECAIEEAARTRVFERVGERR